MIPHLVQTAIAFARNSDHHEVVNALRAFFNA